MNRKDFCPICHRPLRWDPPDKQGMAPGYWFCPKCKYSRPEGSPTNPWKFLKRRR